MQAADNDFHRRDLFEAIQPATFPSGISRCSCSRRRRPTPSRSTISMPTKLIPEELVPLTVIGRWCSNRWPDNFFAETEQVAFCPSHVVPGIDFSNDPLLQGRLFSYLDTQLSRLGSPNFHQIPINAPKCPFANQQRDGHMQMQVPKGRVAYEPSSLDAKRRARARRGFAASPSRPDDGAKGRIRAESFADHYSQARLFFRSQTEIEQAHIASALVFELSKVETPHVREAIVGHLRNIDEVWPQRVADGLGLRSCRRRPGPPLRRKTWRRRRRCRSSAR